MNRSVTGEYEITNVGGELVKAFIPAKLPPDPPLIWRITGSSSQGAFGSGTVGWPVATLA